MQSIEQSIEQGIEQKDSWIRYTENSRALNIRAISVLKQRTAAFFFLAEIPGSNMVLASGASSLQPTSVSSGPIRTLLGGFFNYRKLNTRVIKEMGGVRIDWAATDFVCLPGFIIIFF